MEYLEIQFENFEIWVQFENFEVWVRQCLLNSKCFLSNVTHVLPDSLGLIK